MHYNSIHALWHRSLMTVKRHKKFVTARVHEWGPVASIRQLCAVLYHVQMCSRGSHACKRSLQPAPEFRSFSPNFTVTRCAALRDSRYIQSMYRECFSILLQPPPSRTVAMRWASADRTRGYTTEAMRIPKASRLNTLNNT